MKLLLSLALAAPLAAALVVYFFLRRPHAGLHAGSMAPDFKLQDDKGAWRTLQEFRGKNVVLYFYPHDDTPGCTAQACSFRDLAYLYGQHGIVVLGINYDSPESHAAFKEKYRLPFTLLSDADHTVTYAYGAQGATPLLPQRITFLIDPQGKIIKVLHGIDVKSYAESVLKEFDLK